MIHKCLSQLTSKWDVCTVVSSFFSVFIFSFIAKQAKHDVQCTRKSKQLFTYDKHSKKCKLSNKPFVAKCAFREIKHFWHHKSLMPYNNYKYIFCELKYVHFREYFKYLYVGYNHTFKLVIAGGKVV